MASRDIMPFASPHGGGVERNVAFQIENNGTTVTATFKVGEILLIDANGQVDEHTAATTAVLNKSTMLLALEDAAANIRRIGDPRYGNTPGAAFPVSCAVWSPECEYATRNVYAGNDTNIGPAGTNTLTTTAVGDAVGIRTTASNAAHGIDNTSTGARITRVLDSQGRDTYISGAATSLIVFRPD